MKYSKMKVKDREITIMYDPSGKTVYIQLAEGKVVRTLEASDDFVLDIGKNGKLLGIEVIYLEALTEVASRTVLLKVSKHYKSPILRHLHLEAIPQLFAA